MARNSVLTNGMVVFTYFLDGRPHSIKTLEPLGFHPKRLQRILDSLLSVKEFQLKRVWRGDEYVYFSDFCKQITFIKDKKRCVLCLQNKDMKLDFHKNSFSADGRQLMCMDCARIRRRIQYEKNPERERSKNRKMYRKHRKQRILEAKQYYWENRDSILAKKRAKSKLSNPNP